MTKVANTLLATAIVLGAAIVGLTAQSPSREPRKLVIVGRVLYEDKTPVEHLNVMVEEAQVKDGKITTTWKVGADGKVANPLAYTDKTGRFRIEADPSFWAGTGKFVVSGGFLPGTMTNAGMFMAAAGVPMLYEIDPKTVIDAKTKPIDLGDITVKK